ncbi:GxxExxY protein [Patescibacteria group bacterium]|nr:GxxExxY protein [Patescibacteria group bacterium]
MESEEMEPQMNADERRLNALSEDMPLKVFYKNELVGDYNFADILVEDEIIIEVKR